MYIYIHIHQYVCIHIYIFLNSIINFATLGGSFFKLPRSRHHQGKDKFGWWIWRSSGKASRWGKLENSFCKRWGQFSSFFFGQDQEYFRWFQFAFFWMWMIKGVTESYVPCLQTLFFPLILVRFYDVYQHIYCRCWSIGQSELFPQPPFPVSNIFCFIIGPSEKVLWFFLMLIHIHQMKNSSGNYLEDGAPLSTWLVKGVTCHSELD